jgi:acyl carrier protein phosphodiesterase
MNFLAHSYLSGNSEHLLIGNFIADAVKGSTINNFSDKIKEGILLHRSIDTFTDTHPIVQKSKERLYPSYHKYAGVLVDIFYDHFLAKNWHQHSAIQLKLFTANVYRVMLDNFKQLPPRSQELLPYMIKYDWLTNYAKLEGIQNVLNGMSKRTSFVSNMEKAVADLEKNYDLFEAEFNSFFPQLVEHCDNIIKGLDHIK